MIRSELVEDADNCAADVIAGVAGRFNCLDEGVQPKFVMTCVQRREGPGEIRRGAALKPDPRGESIRREASVDAIKNLLGLLGLSAAEQDPSQWDCGVGAFRIDLQGATERLLIVLLNEQVRLRGDQRVEEALHGGGGLSADELRNHPALAKGFDRGDSLNPVGARNRRVGVDIDFYQLQQSGALGSLALKDGSKLPAGAAPSGPEVDNNRE